MVITGKGSAIQMPGIGMRKNALPPPQVHSARGGARLQWLGGAKLSLGGRALGRLTLGGLTLGGLALVGSAIPAWAVGLADCQAPGPSEYLLLVVVQDEVAQEKLRQAVPPSVKTPTCNYLGSRVARMGGFRKPEDADAWAKYLRETSGLAAFIAQPSGTPYVPSGAIAPPPTAGPTAGTPPATSAPGTSTPGLSSPATPTGSSTPSPSVTAGVTSPAITPPAVPTSPTPPSTTPSATPPTTPVVAVAPASSPAFAPQVMMESYAVLVDYTQQPAIAAQVRNLTQQAVGLVAYGQKPFLLAQATNDSAIAINTLRSLTNSGYRALVVDGRGVIVLTRQVRF